VAVRPGGGWRRRKGKREGQRESASQNRHHGHHEGGDIHEAGTDAIIQDHPGDRFPPLSHLRETSKSVFCPRLRMSRVLWQGEESIRHHPAEVDPLFSVSSHADFVQGLCLKELRSRPSTPSKFLRPSGHQRSHRSHRRALRSIQYDTPPPVSTPPAGTTDPGHIAPRLADADAFLSFLDGARTRLCLISMEGSVWCHVIFS